MAVLEQKLVEQANGVVQNQFPSAVPISRNAQVDVVMLKTT